MPHRLGWARDARVTSPGFGSAWRRARLTAQGRGARGKRARAESPRPAHREWVPAPDRPDPVALLAEQAEHRVPELVPIRHGRMVASPFAFFRGAALIMAAHWRARPTRVSRCSCVATRT